MVCLDTSFIIDVLQGDEKVKDIEKRIDEGTEFFYVTSPSIMELINGANLSNNPKSEEEKVNKFLSSVIVLEFGKESAVISGRIKAELSKKGEMIDIEDIMIGAIALHNNESVVTKNKKHFEKIKGLRIESY